MPIPSILSTPWIPVIQSPGSASTLMDLKTLWEARYEVHDFGGNAFLCSATLRLLSTCQCLGGPSEFPLIAEFDAPASSAIAPDAYLSFHDGGGAAYEPLSYETGWSEAVLLQAIVQAYFSDRAGLKFRLNGLMSGSSPPQIGKTSILRAGSSIGETLDLNVPQGDGWADFFLHRWRQILVLPEGLVVAPAPKYEGELVDPWARDSGRMAHCRGDYSKVMTDDDSGEFIAITTCMSQAKILSTNVQRFFHNV